MENRKRAGCGTEKEKDKGKKSNLPEKVKQLSLGGMEV